jgi:acetyl-CoA acetyltransferase
VTRAAQGLIVGAAETERLGRIPDRSALELHAEAARAAIADAGLTKADIDGLATAGMPPVTVAHHLGLQPSFMDGTYIGGGSFLLHVRHAIAAIDAGLCENVLITHGSSSRSRVGHPPRVADPASPAGQFEHPYGAVSPPMLFPIGLLRYMKEFGLTHEQLAEVPVAQREWASRVSRARFRDRITVEDVLASRMVAYPLHLLQCCLVTDGGGAVVVTSARPDKARWWPKPPVYVLGTGEAMAHSMISGMADFTTSGAFARSSELAFAQARLGPSDIDHLMIYDAFAHLPIYALEDCGFLKRGEAGAFIAEGHTRPGGSLPVNTNGGGLSYTHTGLYGMFLLLEAVRQVRGEAQAQVPGVEVSMVQAVGGMFEAAGTLILGSSDARVSR